MSLLQLDLLGDPLPTLTFERDAVNFIAKYAKARRVAFSPEEVIAAAKAAGIHIDDDRKWGGKFTAAAPAGFIVQSEELFPRVTSNMSKRPGWRAA